MKKKKNLKDSTNQEVGIVNKIITTLSKRRYGRHRIRAEKLMRESMLKRSILSNSESWINLTQKDIDTLEKPDPMLQRNILSLYGNPS